MLNSESTALECQGPAKRGETEAVDCRSGAQVVPARGSGGAACPRGIREPAHEHGEAHIAENMDSWCADDEIVKRHRDETASRGGKKCSPEPNRRLQLW